MRLHLRYAVEFGRQAEVVVRACWAQKMFETDTFDEANDHVLRHKVTEENEEKGEKSISWLMRAGTLPLNS
jgi:hypothetical protein